MQDMNLKDHYKSILRR